MLEISHLSFFYEKRKHFYLPKTKVMIFEGLNFSLKIGENLLIYGSSGSGKSTLGKVIAGLLKPQEGEIKLEGQRITGLIPHKIQYVFQDQKIALNPYRKIGALIKDVASDELEIVKFLEMFGLDIRILELKPQALSSGEAQRVGLLRALLRKPLVVICDEVMDLLDLEMSYQILGILKDYQQSHRVSYIFISHSKEILEGMYQGVLYLKS